MSRTGRGRPLPGPGVDRRRFLQLAAGTVAGLGTLAGGDAAARAAPAPESLALRVHRGTRNTRAGAIGRALWPGRGSARAGPRPGGVRVALPAPGGGGGPPLAGVVSRFAPAARLDSAELPLATLARLLHLTNGITRPGRVPLRAAPSAGALYAGEVYVVAARVPGLAPGAYAFDVFGHELVRVADAKLAAVAAALEAPESIARAPACVLLTNVFARYAQRYASRGYRYALIDTGHIGENLRLAAAGEGLATCSPLRFEDRALNRLLGCDGREEAVCAVHGIGAAAAGDGSERSRGLVEAHTRADFDTDEDRSEPERYHAATSLVPGDARTDAAVAAEDAPAAAGGLAFPDRDPPAASVAAAIAVRRSAARFDAGSLSLADLGFLLRCAQGNAAAAQARGIELRVLAHRVDGIEPGIHRHLPAAHRLVPVAAGEAIADDTRSACGGQERAGSAAAGFAMLADLASGAGGHGRRYRDLLVEAGAIGQRIYLAAEAIGLAARNLAAFYDDELNALLRADGRRQAVVHLTMAGPGH